MKVSIGDEMTFLAFVDTMLIDDDDDVPPSLSALLSIYIIL